MMTTITADRIGDSLADLRSRAAVFLLTHRASLLWAAPVLALGALALLINMGGAPQRIDDEGTYVAQAYAVLNFGELAHYTYWYDHPPLGWIQLAAYAGITGAFERYDLAVLAGREFSIVMTLVSAVLLWKLGRRLGFARPAAAVTMLLFLLSPLAIQYHRTVYLDNIATPWLLAAFLLALSRKGQLASYIGAAAAMGVAVLSKETYLLALPFLAWVIWRGARPEIRRYTFAVAGAVLVLVGSSYLVLAGINGEIMPGADRVSLWEGITYQLFTRDASGSIFAEGTLAATTFGLWSQLDPVFMIVGAVASVGALFVKRLRPFAVMMVFLIAMMLRPGYLPVPYIIMLIPFAALLTVGVAVAGIEAWRRRRPAGESPRRRRTIRSAAVGAGVGALTAVAVAVPAWGGQLRGMTLADLDAPMADAQQWVRGNLDRDARLIVDDAMWVDLVEAGWQRDNVIWYYKTDTDPAVQALNPNGWRDTDYIVTTDSMRTFVDDFPTVTAAIENSVVVQEFGEGDTLVEVRRVVPEGVDTLVARQAAERAEVARAADAAFQPAPVAEAPVDDAPVEAAPEQPATGGSNGGGESVAPAPSPTRSSQAPAPAPTQSSPAPAPAQPAPAPAPAPAQPAPQPEQPAPAPQPEQPAPQPEQPAQPQPGQPQQPSGGGLLPGLWDLLFG